MNKTVNGFLERNLPKFKDDINISLCQGEKDFFKIDCAGNKLNISANNCISAFHGLYEYLKKYCNVQLSWCGNRNIEIDSLKMFDGVFSKTIEQKYRVYLNYCTLDYSMCWWDFEKWEKEIDFMAMNGINMTLAVIGSEAVLYETLLNFKCSKEEALNCISGPAFWSWQLMTNIIGYLPPKSEKYVYERLELGKKILNRLVELGIQPIQQGFSGHIPTILKEKYPNADILMQNGWCNYPKTAQIDPLDPFFKEFGSKYLENLEKLMGNYHYLACDPFHEGTPPKQSKEYLTEVGKIINKTYQSFDENSVWVMQAWTLREHIVKAVPKDRILILDLNSGRTPSSKNMWGYPVVAGMLHNFGGKNAMQGKLRHHCKNTYLTLKENGANVVGSGMFMEGIEQNPVIYDLQFELLTSSKKIDLTAWLDNYILRRYKKYSLTLRKAWNLLLETCYKDNGYHENSVGSTLASRPQMMPKMTGPCCCSKVFYDTEKFEKAVALFLSVSDEFENSDGYQYDLCDLLRQALSNRFYTNQKAFSKAHFWRKKDKVKEIADRQLELLLDLDKLISHRSELCLSRWICDAQGLATDDDERKYFDMNARTLVTLWGDINASTSALYDYSWREWSGLIKEYYYVRWSMFYKEVIKCMENHKRLVIKNGNGYLSRSKYLSYDFGRKLGEFELEWGKTYKEYEYPADKNVIPFAKTMADKWNIK